MNDKNENLENFGGWDENVPEIDFFGESSEPIKTEATEVVADVEKDTVEDKAVENKTETKEPEIDFFGAGEETTKVEITDTDDENVEEVKAEDKVDDEPETKIDNSVSTVSFLKEKGLIEFELEEGTELTPELAEEILEDSFDEKIEDRVEELFGKLPQIVKDLNKYAINGGDINQFFNSIAKQKESGITADIDLTQESNQELVIKNQLKSEGYDDEYISSQLEFLKDSNKLDKIAQTHFDKWKTENEKEQTRLLEQQKERVRLEKENRRKLKSKVTSFINETEDLSGIQLSKDDKKILPSYMTDRNVKLQNGSTITPMQRDLYAALQDDSKAVLIAKLLKSDFNFKDIAVNAETKVTKKVKENIRRNKTNTPSKSATGSSQKQNKRLADYF